MTDAYGPWALGPRERSIDKYPGGNIMVVENARKYGLESPVNMAVIYLNSEGVTKDMMKGIPPQTYELWDDVWMTDVRYTLNDFLPRELMEVYEGLSGEFPASAVHGKSPSETWGEWRQREYGDAPPTFGPIKENPEWFGNIWTGAFSPEKGKLWQSMGNFYVSEPNGVWKHLWSAPFSVENGEDAAKAREHFVKWFSAQDEKIQFKENQERAFPKGCPSDECIIIDVEGGYELGEDLGKCSMCGKRMRADYTTGEPAFHTGGDSQSGYHCEPCHYGEEDEEGIQYWDDKEGKWLGYVFHDNTHLGGIR